jgi:hypothetical protein
VGQVRSATGGARNATASFARDTVKGPAAFGMPAARHARNVLVMFDEIEMEQTTTMKKSGSARPDVLPDCATHFIK